LSQLGKLDRTAAIRLLTAEATSLEAKGPGPYFRASAIAELHKLDRPAAVRLLAAELKRLPRKYDGTDMTEEFAALAEQFREPSLWGPFEEALKRAEPEMRARLISRFAPADKDRWQQREIAMLAAYLGDTWALAKGDRDNPM